MRRGYGLWIAYRSRRQRAASRVAGDSDARLAHGQGVALSEAVVWE